MRTWTDRAPEDANLFNPAFCAMVLAKCIDDFVKKAGQPLPYPLVFLVLPIALHPETRAALPHTTVTSLLSWVQENKPLVQGFAARARRMKATTKEAMLFGLAHEVIAVSSQGTLSTGPKRVPPTEKRTPDFTSDARDCVDRAGFVGRWFASAGTAATIYSAWGVTP